MTEIPEFSLPLSPYNNVFPHESTLPSRRDRNPGLFARFVLRTEARVVLAGRSTRHSGTNRPKRADQNQTPRSPDHRRKLQGPRTRRALQLLHVAELPVRNADGKLNGPVSPGPDRR